MTIVALDPQSDSARLANHRRLHNIGLPPHPDVASRVDLRELDSNRAAREQLIEMGWTPPKHPVDKPQVPVRAWMHPVSELASTDPTAYTGLSSGPPREMVFKDDVYDHIDWLEHGIDEWKSVALSARADLEKAHARSLLLRNSLEGLVSAVQFTPVGVTVLKRLQEARVLLSSLEIRHQYSREQHTAFNSYTALCKRSDGEGGTWVGSVQAECQDSALMMARAKCAIDWEISEGHVLVVGLQQESKDFPLIWNDEGLLSSSDDSRCIPDEGECHGC